MKTITFAIMHFSIAFIVVYLMTGSIALGGMVAIIEPACNTVGYFFHERAWERFRGRTKSHDSNKKTQFTASGRLPA